MKFYDHNTKAINLKQFRFKPEVKKNTDYLVLDEIVALFNVIHFKN